MSLWLTRFVCLACPACSALPLQRVLAFCSIDELREQVVEGG